MNTQTRIDIDGFTLSAEQVIAIARDPNVQVGLAPSSRDASAC